MALRGKVCSEVSCEILVADMCKYIDSPAVVKFTPAISSSGGEICQNYIVAVIKSPLSVILEYFIQFIITSSTRLKPS